MSGHLRLFCSAAFLLLAGLSTSPAFSNPFSGLWGQADPVEASPPAPSKADCVSQPGKSSAEGQHWVYRLDGHRKCWFQVAEGTLTSRKSVRYHAAKHLAVSKKSEATPHSRKVVVDARAELLPSAPTDANRLAPSAVELKVADASPVADAEAEALAPSVPAIATLPADRFTALNPKARQVDLEMRLAAAPADGDAVVPPVTPADVVPAAKAGDDGPGWTATWLGVLLMTMGLVVLLGSSRTLRGGVRAV